MITDADIYENPTINIGIMGCISSGKSTLMNSLFSETYSDMKIKKTTMCPQVYRTDRNLTKNKKYANEIRKQNEEINKKLYEAGNSNKCEEVIYNVLPIPDIFDKLKFGKNIEYKIYDIPGLNDSVTKNKFYDYIKNNFYKFDIVIYNVDINSGLNTTDELDILKLIKQCIADIKTKYNKEVKLMIICNKCDDLIEDNDGNLIGSEEIEEMYKQVCDIVKSNGVECPIIKYSAAYTYMYRSINTPENIDIEYINKIGIDNFGRVPWSKQSRGKTMEQLWTMIKPHLSDSSTQSLVLSGFDNFKEVICDRILMGKLMDIMYSKISFHSNIVDFMTKYNFIKKLDVIFKNTSIKILSDIFSNYIKYLTNKYNFQSITDTNITQAEEYFNILQNLASLELSKKDIATVKELMKEFNTKKALYDIQLIQSNKEIGIGGIFPILTQIIEKTTDGITMLSKPEIIEKLQKVPLEDFYKMIMYLYDHKIDYKILTNIYSSKLINIINSSEYSSMVKNYLTKLYFESGDEFYNWMSCCIKISVISSVYEKEKYEKLISKVKEFIKFYNLHNKLVDEENSDNEYLSTEELKTDNSNDDNNEIKESSKIKSKIIIENSSVKNTKVSFK